MLVVVLHSPPPLPSLVSQMAKTTPGAADLPGNHLKKNKRKEKGLNQWRADLRQAFKDNLAEQTSEKSLVSAFLIADSAIQFLRTYLGLMPERHISHITILWKKYICSIIWRIMCIQWAKTSVIFSTNCYRSFKMLTFHPLLTTEITILMLPNQMGFKRTQMKISHYKIE